ncbi:MAG TPA: aldolase/citrate lyase family protein [Streptosporangiaceae bacterium]|nr:aldolase/citrate lyase family protein [Streptosporangiaceae bacterium]
MENRTLGERLAAGETLYGGWNVTGDVTAAGLLAAGGLDYVVVDLQHGAATERELPALTAAVERAGATPLARVRYAHPADIGRALDLGCTGVIVPNVDSAQQARAAAGACRFPPAGYRSGGGVLASPRGPLCLIMVESRAAMADLDQTLATDGVDGIYVGPRDLSYSLGCAFSPGDAVLRAALEQIWAACLAAGKPVGVHSTDGATARIYRENGCRLVNVASDVTAISRTVAAELAVVRA